MRLKTTLFLLALLAFISSLIGVYVHYTSLQASFLSQAREEGESKAEAMRIKLSAFLSEQLKPVSALAGMEQLEAALIDQGEAEIKAANKVLDHFNSSLGVDVCYLMDSKGKTIASSNRFDADSFVGQNFKFRPYFQFAMRSTPRTYLALGTTSLKRGVYFSYPVHSDKRLEPIGVVVIKDRMERLEELFSTGSGELIFLTAPSGLIFASSSPKYILTSDRKMSPETQSELAASRQFGAGPWQWSGFSFPAADTAYDREGKKYLVYRREVERFPGWSVQILLESDYDYLNYLKPLYSENRPLVLPLILLICVSVGILYRRASTEVLQRRNAEAALRQNEERFRTLYNQTPAMLHSIDPSGKIVRVSDYWSELLGYSREEVVGRNLTDFMSEESRSHAINVVLPRFLKEGFAKEVEYTFIKKSGEPIDVLLSAIAERDEEGKIFRSIAVLIDVTERKRAERGLQKARKMLENYSRDLERQVRERTLEITNILKYTPAVVSLKDRDGRYLLVNSRFSEMFNIAADRVRGRSDEEIFPPEVAALLSGNDGRVLEKKEPFSVEERMEWEGAVGVYLSVKFPLFDEGGAVTGVGSISTDVTALKEAQEELRRLSSRVLEGQERERAAVARELHDELGQVLTALKMDAVWLSDRLKGGDEKAAAHALKMSENIDRTIDEVRGMVMSLRPGVLDDLGLIAALEWLSDEVERRTGIPCTFRHSDLPRLGSAAETAIYRIAQEALTNVARHSGAARAEVALKREEGNLILTVHDDGEGFEVGPEKQFESYGLSGIRERAELIGGIVEITSDSSGGTKVKFTLPIEGHIREIEN